MLGALAGFLEKFIEERSTPLPKVCKEIAEFTKKEIPQHAMLSSPLQALLLKFLVEITSSKKVLELGTFTGYATLAMASGLPPDGKIVSIDREKKYLEIARKFWDKDPNGGKIQEIHGEILKVLPRLEEGWDFVFIDADKINLIGYLELSLEKISPQGLIVVDNIFWGGKVFLEEKDEETQAIQAFTQYVVGREDLEKLLLPIRDGLYLIRKK